MGNVLGKCLSVPGSLFNFFRLHCHCFFVRVLKKRQVVVGDANHANNNDCVRKKKNGDFRDIKDKEESEKELENKKKRQRQPNYVLRAIKETTIHERILLGMALIFLGINAYTNLNFPRIIGECIESNNIKYANCSFLDKILQTGNFLRRWKINSSSLQTVVHYVPYFIVGGMASYFRIFFTNKCIKSIECRLKKKVHKKILIEDSEEFRAFKSCDYLANCIFNEIKYCSKELINCITQMLRYMNSIIGGMVAMTLISSYLTKFCIFLVPTYGFFVLLILRSMNKVKQETMKMDEKQMERFSDVLQKRNVVFLFGNEYYENKYFSAKLANLDKLYNRHLNAEALFYCFLNVGTNVVICSMLCFGKRELTNKNISHGQLISFIVYSSMLGLGIVGLLKLKKEVNVLQMSLHKIYEILDFSKYRLSKQKKADVSVDFPDETEICHTDAQCLENKNENTPKEVTNNKYVNKKVKNKKNKSTINTNNKKQNNSPNINRGSPKGATTKMSTSAATHRKEDDGHMNAQHRNDTEINNKYQVNKQNTMEVSYDTSNDASNSSNITVDKKNAFPEDIKGSIRFENVNFWYNCFDGTKKNYVLKNINFEIKEHEKVAIIGKSGSGKTTLWKLLTQEFEYDGTIYIDSYNLKDINKTYFKKRLISISEQECTVLNRSLYENLLYGILPVKIGNRTEVPELLFDGVNKRRALYKKIQALAKKMENEEEEESHASSSSASSSLPEEDLLCFAQYCDYEDTKYDYLKYKCYAYLKNTETKSTPIFSKEEKDFIKMHMEECWKKRNADSSKKNCTNNTNIDVIVRDAKKQNSQLNEVSLYNDDTLINESLVKCYNNKVNEINASVKILCNELDLNGLISSLPQKLQSPIHNNSISSGQKQRVAIIRSLMKNTPIYVFDEITSALDDSNVEKVFQTISSSIPNKTVIYITHSIKMLNHMDKIIVIDNGQIAAIGTYDEIKNSPHYLNVFPSQKQ